MVIFWCDKCKFYIYTFHPLIVCVVDFYLKIVIYGSTIYSFLKLKECLLAMEGNNSAAAKQVGDMFWNNILLSAVEALVVTLKV